MSDLPQLTVWTVGHSKHEITDFIEIILIHEIEVIVDVRTSAEYDSGHIPNSVNIEWQDIMKLNKTSAKDKYIYLYCRSGNRSGKAAKILNDNGFINVVNAGSLEEAQIIIDSVNAQEIHPK